MALTYNRAELMDRLNKAIALAKAKQWAENDKAVERFEAAKGRWNDRYAAEWTAALTKLRAKLKKGEPITSADLPQETAYVGGRPAVFRETAPGPDVRAPRDMAELLAAVRTIENDSITPTQLATVISGSKFRAAMASLGFYEGAGA